MHKIPNILIKFQITIIYQFLYKQIFEDNYNELFEFLIQNLHDSMDPSNFILALSSIQALTDVFEDISIKDKINEEQIIIYFRKIIKLISIV